MSKRLSSGAITPPSERRRPRARVRRSRQRRDGCLPRAAIRPRRSSASPARQAWPCRRCMRHLERKARFSNPCSTRWSRTPMSAPSRRPWRAGRSPAARCGRGVRHAALHEGRGCDRGRAGGRRQRPGVADARAQRHGASPPGDKEDCGRLGEGWRGAPGLGAADAGESLSAITSYTLFAELKDAGWSSRKYESWLVDSINRLILD